MEHDARQRAESYLFPQEFAALRPLLGQYLEQVFATSSFETRFTPRGIYFTSGTQEGLPFDRVMGELNRYLQLPPVTQGHRPTRPGTAWARKRRSRQPKARASS